MRPTILAFLVAIVGFARPLAALAADCQSLDPPRVEANSAKSPITAKNLFRLRDIGPVSNGDPEAPVLAVSPDGAQVAFQLRQVNGAGTGYCLGMYVLDLKAQGTARRIDLGGEPVPTTFSAWGFAENVPNGTIAPAAPQWSPDGRSVAYLRRDNGRTQVWRAGATGTGAAAVTAFDTDVESYRWAKDGQSLEIELRPGLTVAKAALVREGEAGYLFGDRMVPSSGPTPLPLEPIETQHVSVILETGALRVNEPKPSKDDSFPNGAIVSARSRSGDWVWATRRGPALNAATELHMRIAGRETVCTDPLCSGMFAVMWSEKPGVAVVLRREGWRLSQTGIYVWAPGMIHPKAVRVADDVMLGCQVARNELICAQETSLQPRRLVSINLDTGRLSPVFDPNPEFARFELGTVERIKWTNTMGVPTFADLVLPAAYQHDKPLPLIVVQYDSRGFLRGGTGDDYPIFPFAAHGFAVLSFQRPIDIGYYQASTSAAETNRLDRVDWADRRSVQSSLETVIQSLVERGIVDRKRIGITGLSDGASTVQFALVNSDLFAAAAMSTCCEEPSLVNLMNGPAPARVMHQAGYPGLLEKEDVFWQPVSFRRNAQRIKTPLLLQLADREYLGALEGYSALKEARQPVEMFVFPDEYHIKWHPEHRLATYQRSLDWFDFWLRGHEDEAPDKAVQYARWQQLKADASKNASDSPGP